MNILKKIPFTYHWILRRAIGNDTKTILDLGCGEGDLMGAISAGQGWKISGVELFEKACKKAQKSGVYVKVYRTDVTELAESITSKKYDVVFASQVLEHLRKKKGEQAIKIWESLTKKRIVISTPVGFIEYEPIETKEEDNPLQKHRSGWLTKELKANGYLVRGQGVRFVYGEQGMARKWPVFLPVFYIISMVFAPLVYFCPNLGTYMIAWKETDPQT